MVSFTDILEKTTVANVVAAVAVVAAIAYAVYYNDKDMITFLAGAGVGYLFKETKQALTMKVNP